MKARGSLEGKGVAKDRGWIPDVEITGYRIGTKDERCWKSKVRIGGEGRTASRPSEISRFDIRILPLRSLEDTWPKRQ